MMVQSAVQLANLVQVPKRSGISQLHGQRGGAQHSSSVPLCVYVNV